MVGPCSGLGLGVLCEEMRRKIESSAMKRQNLVNLGRPNMVGKLVTLGYRRQGMEMWMYTYTHIYNII